MACSLARAKAPAVAGRLGPRPLPLLLQAAATRGRAPLGRMLDGLKAYWAHPARSPGIAGTEAWCHGGSRLIDQGPADGRPLLVLPSVVNSPDILDLLPEHSLLGPLRDRVCGRSFSTGAQRSGRPRASAIFW